MRTATRTTQPIVRRHRPDHLIALCTGILMLLSLVIIYAIGPQRANVLNNAYGGNYSDMYFFLKQLVSLGLAGAAFVFMALVPYNFILKHGSKILAIGLIACIVLAVSAAAGLAFATPINGATRWFSFGALGSIQPAEILKFGLLLYLAVFLGTRARQGRVDDFKETLVPVGIISAASLFLIVFVQADLGTGISVTSIIITMLIASGIKAKYLLRIFGILLVAGVFMIVSAPHRMDRMTTFFQGDSTSTSDAGAYHIEHAKIAIGSGGLTGVGIGNSVQATGYLPEAINDSVFAVLGEIFGFVGLVTLLALFSTLLLRLLHVMDHLVDTRLKLVVAGVFGWFGSHVILNIAAMIGIFPLTGITLPMLSFGGTSMIFITAALGLAFQLSRYTAHGAQLATINKEERYENSLSRRRVGRTRYASRRSA